MGKPTGFLEYGRQTGAYRPAEERRADYKEVYVSLPDDQLAKQGARCMDCGIPFCHALGCPVYNLIPEWNDLIYQGKWKEALQRLERTNNLPEITGRICPAPCEAACTLSINDAPVSIKQIELSIIEHAFDEGWIVPRPPARESGKRVAVIGSGPAGLAASQQLRRSGHEVTLYEKDPKFGGILRYGIPDFKLEKWVLDRRLEQMRAEGVRFEPNVYIGEDLSTSYLLRKFDAVLLSIGAGEPRDLPVEGRDLEGVHFAMDYLCGSNKARAGECREDDIIQAQGKSVLVIGGGDTGSDCVGTANRQGAKTVRQFEIMPRPMEWDKPWNPQWPEWPRILRTSSSHLEGCEREWSVTTKRFLGKKGKLSGVECARVEWKKGEDGRMSFQEVPGSTFTVDVELAVLAMGFLHPRHDRLLADFGVEFTGRGAIKTDDYQTNVSGVFAAGDAEMGASLVVRAISQGREAAASIGRYLSTS